MRGLFFDGCLHFRDDLERPEPREGEALIRVRCAGICSTDLESLKGYMGFQGIPGHEFVGIVEKAPQTSWVGKRVTGEINCPCRVCPACRAGRSNHCPDRTVLGIAGRNGTFAEYLTLPHGTSGECWKRSFSLLAISMSSSTVPGPLPDLTLPADGYGPGGG